MLIVHPASVCDVCTDPYIASESAKLPHAIECGHIFCLTCLRRLSPSACPLCRKTFRLDHAKILHVADPPDHANNRHVADPLEVDGTAEAAIKAEAMHLLQRVALVSGEDVLAEVSEWIANNSAGGDSRQALCTSLAALQQHKALQERNEREYAEYRRVCRELRTHQPSVYQDPEMSRVIEESLLNRINEIESRHASEVSQDGCPQLTPVFQSSQLHPDGTYRIALNNNSPFPTGSPHIKEPPCCDNGEPVFLGSAIFNTSVHPCKIVPHLFPPCFVPYGGNEVQHLGRYNLLPFDPETMEWAPASYGRIPTHRSPVQGGYEENGAMLYHAIAFVRGVRVPGKTGEHLGGCNVAYGGVEHIVTRGYDILCWK